MKRLIGLVLAVALLVTLYLVTNRRNVTRVRAQLVPLTNQPTNDLAAYARAEGPRPLSFPADFGPHDDFQTEWWYYTGNLETPDGRHFGYQLTFFRRALAPPSQRVMRQSNWAADQAYLAHFALTDVADKRFQSFERLSRGAAGLAGAQAEPFQVWLDDWSIVQVEPDVYHLRAAQNGSTLELTLRDVQGPILQGDRGYSQKGPEPGNASYYYSLARLESRGTIRVGDTVYQVNGLSWMDHEFSTSYLTPDQIGWDWFALQLDDGSALMLFQIRRKGGGMDPFASGTFIAPDGSTRWLHRDDFQITAGATWRSPRSGATYPAAWTIKVPALDLTLDVKPYSSDQELDVSVRYWEGAVHLTGEHNGHIVNGDGYVELTGYTGSIGGQF